MFYSLITFVSFNLNNNQHDDLHQRGFHFIGSTLIHPVQPNSRLELAKCRFLYGVAHWCTCLSESLDTFSTASFLHEGARLRHFQSPAYIRISRQRERDLKYYIGGRPILEPGASISDLNSEIGDIHIYVIWTQEIIYFEE